MITLKVIGLGAIISYGIACLMKLTMFCIQGFSKKGEDEEK